MLCKAIETSLKTVFNDIIYIENLASEISTIMTRDSYDGKVEIGRSNRKDKNLEGKLD